VFDPAWKITTGSSQTVAVFVGVEDPDSGSDLAISSPGEFTYAVSVASVVRASDGSSSGTPAGGQKLTITGEGFGSSANLVTVEFCPPGSTGITSACVLGSSNGFPAFAPNSDTRIEVFDPAWKITTGSSQTVAVFVGVEDPDSGSDLAISSPGEFTYAK
jgi:hypothetical protein